jgi:molybdopterin converting factor small subunit
LKDIQVQVKVYGALQMNIGWKQQDFTLPTSSVVNDLLDLLVQKEASLQLLLEGEAHSLSSLIMLNSTDIKKMDGFQTKLGEGDVITIISMISGG